MHQRALTLSTLLLGLALICLPFVAFASDAGAPTAEAPRAIGGTVFSGYINETNTHIRLNVSVGNDAANIGGEVRTYVSLNTYGPSDVEVGARHTILAGQIGTKFDVADIAIADVLTAISTSTLQEGFSLTFKKRVYEADTDPLSLVSLGTLTVALTSNHPAPSISHAYVGLSTISANSYTFSTTTPSFEFVITNDSDLNTLTCTINSFFTDNCFSYTLSGATQSYSYASTTRSLSDGSHTLTVVATDTFGQAATSTVSFCVTSCSSESSGSTGSSVSTGNGPPDLIGVVNPPPPSESISAPALAVSVPEPTPLAPSPESILTSPVIPATPDVLEEKPQGAEVVHVKPRESAPKLEPESAPIVVQTAAVAIAENEQPTDVELWALLLIAVIAGAAVMLRHRSRRQTR